MQAKNPILDAKLGGRRAFLKGAAAAGMAGAAGVAAAGARPEATPAAGEPRAERNYRETAHIRAYYRAARF